MKKTAAAVLAAAVLACVLLAGCVKPEDVEIINVVTTVKEEETAAPVDIIATLSPSEYVAPVPVDDLPLKIEEFPVEYAEEILFGDIDLGYGYSAIPDSLAGADMILKLEDRYLFVYTNTENTIVALYCAIPTEDELFFSYYAENDLVYLWGSDTAWYFKDGVLDFVVYTAVTRAGGEVYTFYTPEGAKVLARLGDEYYDPENNLLSEEELHPLKVRYGDAVEFDDIR